MACYLEGSPAVAEGESFKWLEPASGWNTYNWYGVMTGGEQQELSS